MRVIPNSALLAIKTSSSPRIRRPASKIQEELKTVESMQVKLLAKNAIRTIM